MEEQTYGLMDKQTYGHRERGGDGELFGESNMETYIQFSSVSQSCPTLFNPMDCTLPGSSVHGIFQARVLEWIAIDLLYFHLLLKVLISYKGTKNVLSYYIELC